MMRMLFPDGTEIKGISPVDLLCQIAKIQWEEVGVDAMKHLLAARARAWNNAVIDPTLDDDSFISALGESGMVFVYDHRPKGRIRDK